MLYVNFLPKSKDKKGSTLAESYLTRSKIFKTRSYLLNYESHLKSSYWKCRWTNQIPLHNTYK